jgi:hypothetical protein
MAAEQMDDPAIIEDEVERTQDAMGDTVDKLEQKLNPRNFTESLLGEERAATARDAWDVIRRDPIPVAMIVGGAAWLFARSDSPLVSRMRDQLITRIKEAVGVESDDSSSGLRSRSDEPAPIGPPAEQGEQFDRRT